MQNLNIPEKEEDMKNDNDIKELEPILRQEECFISGYFGSCFLSTYALQLWLLLWDDAYKLLEHALFGVKEYGLLPGLFYLGSSELTVFSFLPIVPLIFTLLALYPGSMAWEFGYHRRFGNFGAFVVGVAWWFFGIAFILVLFQLHK